MIRDETGHNNLCSTEGLCQKLFEPLTKRISFTGPIHSVHKLNPKPETRKGVVAHPSTVGRSTLTFAWTTATYKYGLISSYAQYLLLIFAS